MEELKACNVRAMWDAVNELENAVMHPGKKKGLSTETLSIAIAAIHKIAEQTRHKNAANLRAEPESKPVAISADTQMTIISEKPENKPLTLEQLREMDGEPVWVKEIDGTGCGEWTIIDIGAQTEMLKALSPDTGYKEYNYGKTWIAYVRKPEGSEKSLTTQRK